MRRPFCFFLFILFVMPVLAWSAGDGVWKYKAGDSPKDGSGNFTYASTSYDDSSWSSISQGGSLPSSGFCWLRGKVTIPTVIGTTNTFGQTVGLRLSADSGAEAYLAGSLYTRFDSDHQGVVLLSTYAVPGTVYNVALRCWCDANGNGENSFSWTYLQLLTYGRVANPVYFSTSAASNAGTMPRPFSALAQPVGWSVGTDTNFAQLVKNAGFQYVRMDHLLENITKNGSTYDFSDADAKLAYVVSMGAQPIVCLSYMPSWLRARTDQDMRSSPSDFTQWQNLVYATVYHFNVVKGYHIKYWEVWNEPNSPWWYYPPDPRTDAGDLSSYEQLYRAAATAVKQADSTAWIGGPALASGPWDNSTSRSYCIRGNLFGQGLTQYCKNNNVPLDFISWHEYFQTYDIFQQELAQWKALVSAAGLNVKSYIVTESGYAWWTDSACAYELGAARASDLLSRFAVPGGIDALCTFQARDNSTSTFPVGDFGIVTSDGKPKPTFNVLQMWNKLGSTMLTVNGSDTNVSVTAAKDASGNVGAVITHYAANGEPPVHVSLNVYDLLGGGTYKSYLVDATHCNLLNSSSNYSLALYDQGTYTGTTYNRTITLPNNAVLLVQVMPVVTPVTEIYTLKLGAVGAGASISNKIVSAVFPGMFYVQSDDRSNGIGVIWSGTVNRGDRVSVQGTMAVNSDQEVYINASSVTASGSGTAIPLGLNNKALGGRAYGLQAQVGGANTVNNVGLLVRSFGKITSTGSSSFTIDSGDWEQDGSQDTVTCTVPSTVTINPAWKYVIVTGISSCQQVGTKVQRLLKVRDQSDIVQVQ